MTRESKGSWRAGAITAIVMLLTFAVPASSWGYWNASTTLPETQLQAAQVPTVSGFDCVSSGGLASGRANLSWSALSALPDTTWRYQVWLRTSGGITARIDNGVTSGQIGQTQTTLSVSNGLLTSLLGSLIGNILDLLLGSNPPKVYVVAVHPSGWAGPPTPDETIRAVALIGAQCAP